MKVKISKYISWIDSKPYLYIKIKLALCINLKHTYEMTKLD